MSGLIIDTREFYETLKRYLPHVRNRDLPYVLNKKGMIISARATKTTAKADWAKAKAELLANGLAYKIITTQRKQKGKPLPTRAEWPSVLEAFMAARRRSFAFLRAGFIPAIKQFAAVLGVPSTARGLRAKYPIGGAIPAKPGWKVVAELFNAAIGKHGDKASAEGALSKFAAEGLRVSMQKETADMERFIDREFQKTADRFSKTLFR